MSSPGKPGLFYLWGCYYGHLLEVHLDTRPPTLKQLDYLYDLGYRGPRPRTLAEASDLIDELKEVEYDGDDDDSSHTRQGFTLFQKIRCGCVLSAFLLFSCGCLVWALFLWIRRH